MKLIFMYFSPVSYSCYVLDPDVFLSTSCTLCLRSLVNPLNAKLNRIFPFLALFGAHHILHDSRKRVNMKQSSYFI